MKNLFNKSKPLNKIIALWLVFVMMLVPLISYMGDEKGAKAADTDAITCEPTLTLDLAGTTLNTYTFSGDTDETQKGITGINASDITYYFDESVKFKVPTVTVTESVTYGSVTYNVTVDSVIFTSGAENIKKNIASKDKWTEETVTGNTAVSVYASFKLTDSSNGEEVTCYTKVATYTFTKTAAYSSPKLQVKSHDVDSDSWYALTTGNVGVSGVIAAYDGTNASHLGVVKYAYAPYVDGKTSYTDYIDATDSAQTTLSSWSATVPSFTDTNMEGTYIAFVGYFADSTSTEPLKTESLGQIKVDNAAPSIDSVRLLYREDGNWSEVKIDDSNTYEEVETEKPIPSSEISNYRYYIKLSDNGSGIAGGTDAASISGTASGINSNVTLAYDSGSGYYICSGKIFDKGTNLTVTVKDKAGNTGTKSDITAKLVPFEDTYTLKWTYNSIPDYDMTQSTEIYVGPDKNLILDVDCTTDNKIGSVEVTATINGSEITVKKVNNTNNGTSQPYEFETRIDFNDAINKNKTAKLTDIKVKFYDTNDNEVTTAVTSVATTVSYDKTAPVFSFITEPEDKWYTGDTAPEFKFTVKSGDATSNETNLDYVSINDTNISYTSNTDDNPTGTISGITEGKNDVVLKAADMAGNVTTEDYTIKYDNTAPTIDNIGITGSLKISESEIYAQTTSELKLQVKDNLSIGKLVFTYNSKTVTKTYSDEGTDISKEYKVPITDILGNKISDGAYTITVVAYDAAGLYSTEESITFYIDTTAPTLESAKLVAYADSTYTVEVPLETDDHKIIDGKYYINRTKDTREFRYKIEVSDNLSGFDYDSLKVNNPNLTFVKDDDNSNVFYVVVDKDKLSTVNPFDFDLYVADKAGQVAMLWDNTPDLYATDTGMKLSASIYKMVDGVYVEVPKSEYAEIANGTNKQYYVKVSSTTNTDVANIALVNNNGASTVTSKTMSGGWDEFLQLYVYETMFALPTNQNILLENWYAMLTFVDNTTQNSDKLSTLLYDKTIPVVKGADGTTDFASDNVWYNSKTVDFNILSGTAVDESNIKEAYVIVSNSNDDASVSSKNRADGTATVVGGKVVVPESKTVQGTLVQFGAIDKANNQLYVENTGYRFFVDATAPKVGKITVSTNNQVMDTTIPMTGEPVIEFSVKDNLTLDNVQLKVIYPDGQTIKTIPYNYTAEQALAAGSDGISMDYSYSVEKVDGKILDGEYTVEVIAYDKACNPSSTKLATFVVDSTLPVVTSKVVAGATASKSPMTTVDGDSYDYYYCGNVTVDFTYFDLNKKDILITDNGTAIDVIWSVDSQGVYKTSVHFGEEGTHTVVISGTDQAGNQAVSKTIVFYIDKTAPVITTILNGGLVYTETMGVVKMTSDTTLSASVSDVAEDVNDFNIQIIKAVPDQAVSTPEYVSTTARAFSFTDEANYTVNLYAVDMAGNPSATRNVMFRVDKTAPSLSITGASGGTSTAQTTVSFSMKELFWSDASGEIQIYRKANDDSSETLYKTITVTPTEYDTVVSETLTETGEYRFEFSASDWIGHQSQMSQTLIIDRDAPEMVLTLKKNDASSSDIVKNKQSVDVPVYVNVNITDAFYLSKTVTMTGTRVDGDGNVTNLSFGSLRQNVNGTAYEKIFEEDGLYTLTIVARDAAGNEVTQTVQFTIDKDAPVIEDITSIWSGTIQSFQYVDPATLVSDMTACEIHMYLNGVEYDGSEDLPDGAYTLLITAEDELGHVVEMETSFVIDSQPPVFMVTGVEKDQVKDEAYEIVISLQLETDTLVSVKLNGVEQPIVNNMCAITVDTKGDYTLEITAIDEAGNTSTDTYEFKYGEEFNWWIIIVIAIAVILLGIIIIIVAKKRKSNK